MSQSKEYLCVSANGNHVFFDPAMSHAATHFDDTPQLRGLVVGILEQQQLEGSEMSLDIDTGKPVGTSDVVEVDETDVIVYAMRKNRVEQGRVPFTKTRAAQPSSRVSIHLLKQDDSEYDLTSAWIGSFDSPPFPEDPQATAESKPYWSKHAFMWGSQEVISGTELSCCPW
ncbi:hypothetical protein BH23PAT1_BH23PAT1_4380 [soil metagenome]